MRITILLLAVLSTLCTTYSNATTIQLCSEDSERPVASAWTKNIAAALSRLAYSGYVQKDKIYSVQLDKSKTCFDKAGTSCYGEEGTVYCNRAALAQILYATAWTASSVANSIVDQPEETRSRGLFSKGRVDILSGLELYEADAYGSQEDMTRIIERLATIDDGAMTNISYSAITVLSLQQYDADQHAILDTENIRLGLAYQIYEAASNYLMAFIVGHELAHSFKECIFDDPSVIEENLFFNDLANTQASGGALCPNIPLLDELLAEQCALRGVQSTDQGMTEYKESISQGEELKLSLALLSFSRRIAIDSVSALLTIGLGQKPSDKIYRPPTKYRGLDVVANRENGEFKEGYLYKPIRLALFSSLLHTLEPTNKQIVRICDHSSQRFVLGLTYALAICNTERNISPEIRKSKFPDLFSSIVGSGVIDGWLTDKWDDHTSFKCENNSK